ncbi:hypothetical protein QVD17_01237 [Tagetes erecta]|uniref:RRM domain-containing protein n=1 Tax=Tagetes erecta TaxID=13708 RepID=A0AAD8L9C4_TARER|nr:hypothetical protein QVD17_01237 [Tagetes erecta]
MGYGRQHYRSPFGDTTFTKVFVGGLAWETPNAELRTYFEQFGHILEAVIITDKITGKSKGYGFVTFDDAESAKRACNDPNPVIDGRRANCNIASDQGKIKETPSSQEVTSPLGPSSPSAPVFYPPYGYATYPPGYGSYKYCVTYNPAALQYPFYRPTSTSMSSTPYYYGYSHYTPRGTALTPQAQQLHHQSLSYMYYPTQQMTTPLLVLPSGLQRSKGFSKVSDNAATSPGTPNTSN